MVELFGVSTADIDNDVRTNNTKVPLSKQMVNGFKMRELIATTVRLFGQGLMGGQLADFPKINSEYSSNPARLMGFAFGAISDFCFNIEYVRRITDKRWSYCAKANDNRVYYPYLGVCPHCITRVEKPTQAVLGADSDASNAEKESRARYFGNKIESHHVGRIGERVIVYILDLLTKSRFEDSTTLMVFDDQHDVDAAIFFDGIGVLAQIKASPLILLPVMSKLSAPLTDGVSDSTGLPEKRKDHTFTDFAASEHELSLYFSLDDTSLSIGKKDGKNWPYEPMLSQLDEKTVMKIIENWLSIYLSFEIPKKEREGEDVSRAYLTSGWGAPIDDNKTKSGLARSDNMMKGTYASLKYGAYYVQGCQRKTLKTTLVANIDPAHQYADYLEKLEDIRWGHKGDFIPVDVNDGPDIYSIEAKKLTYLFDSVFTFNRQIMNDAQLADAWNLGGFIKRLANNELGEFLEDWGSVDEE